MSSPAPRATSTVPDAGLSLVDVLVGLAITIVVTAGLASFVLFQNRKLGAETRRVAAQQDMRAALELITGDLRTAGRRAPGVDYAGAAFPPGFCAREANRLRMTADLDGDGEGDGLGEDVTYCLCAGTGPRPMYRAYRSPDGASYIVDRVADGVSSLQFSYAPRRVSVTMNVDVETPLGTTTQGTLATAHLRNAADDVACAAGPACPPTECL